ncbi:unnamed protein product [Adineta steineri]|uniref:Uncharacterized protein n=1 Tax=Adineta steineri TaxID=433720 RepID=A0A815BXY8_9BILA|nr:unnamed protein product [Adineta steineri]
MTTSKGSTALKLTTAKSSTTTTTTTTKESGLISLDYIYGFVYGVYNASISQNSQELRYGDGFGGSPIDQTAVRACDGDISTKYLTFGECNRGEIRLDCGLNTGFYMILKRGASLVTGLQICTADDYPQRDPLKVSLEGSNQSVLNLTLGSSWTLIYNGDSGLNTDPGRQTCGMIQRFNNIIPYKSYRFLVSSKRGLENSVQYSELKLFEY